MTLPAPASMLNLSDLVVAVTGAGGGIGQGIVRRFSQAGAAVVAHTNTSNPDHLLDSLAGPKAAVKADLLHPEGPSRVVEAALDSFGKLDALVNNAGVYPVASLSEMRPAEWQEMLDINLTSVHRLTQAVATHLMDRGSPGSVTHIASIEGSQPAFSHGHYSVSKAGVIMHARAAALEWGGHGIRVNSVSPGLIHRPGIEDMWPEGVARWKAAAPLTRLGTPEDIADACLFLASPLARWITGIDLVVDGGVLAHPTW
ncbi:MAG: SDR family oxidoreductase [bacterium]|nr:SDR family oxidoreductase [bacterium]MCY3651899.1 SDR family oxidoreductase [bacterium]MDE0644291.1 SDR family oxidoreductase [bacterium]